MAACDELCRRVEACASDAENSGGAWRHVEGPMKMKFSQKGRSERLLSNDAICGLIGEAEAVVAARQWSLIHWSRGEGSGAAHKKIAGDDTQEDKTA